jgi:hypothetical protein
MCVQKWPIMADGVCRWICSWNHCGTNKMRFLYTGLISGCVKQRLDCSRLKHDHAFYYWKKIHLFKYFSHSNCDASLIVIVLVKRKFTEILPSQKHFLWMWYIQYYDHVFLQNSKYCYKNCNPPDFLLQLCCLLMVYSF